MKRWIKGLIGQRGVDALVSQLARVRGSRLGALPLHVLRLPGLLPVPWQVSGWRVRRTAPYAGGEMATGTGSTCVCGPVEVTLPPVLHPPGQDADPGLSRALRQVHEMHLVVVEGGFIYSAPGTVALLTCDGRIVRNISGVPGGGGLYPLQCRLRLPAVERRSGTAVLVAHPDSRGNYYHWLIEALPRLMPLGGVGFDHIVVGSADPMPAYQRDSLDLLRMDPGRVINLGSGARLLAFDRVIAATSPCVGWASPWTVDWLRSAFTVPLAGGQRRRRIFICRSGASYRRLLNEGTLMPLLQAAGFERIRMEDLPLQEQVRTFASAEVVIGVHGAGLSNCVFCPPGALLVELFAPSYVPQFYCGLAHASGLRYRYALGRPGDPHRSVRADLAVDPLVLHALLLEEGLVG